MNVVTIAGIARTELGTPASRAIRREGKVPCVIYGGDKPVHFTLEEPDLKPIIYTAAFNLIQIDVDGQSYRTVVKDVQFHPVSEEIVHVDFQLLVEGTKVKVFVPVKLIGDSVGVREGGSLVAVMRRLQIKANPEHLVPEIQGDITKLRLSQSICVRDMIVPEGIEILQDPNSPVGYIEVPRSLKSAESAALKAGVAGEEEAGEVESEG